jgi:hypothetical protein
VVQRRTAGSLQHRIGRYRCFTANRVNVAEATILNGTGRVGEGATPEYRDRETEAASASRALKWRAPMIIVKAKSIIGSFLKLTTPLLAVKSGRCWINGLGLR